jgi:hypothetical protein
MSATQCFSAPALAALAADGAAILAGGSHADANRARYAAWYAGHMELLAPIVEALDAAGAANARITDIDTCLLVAIDGAQGACPDAEVCGGKHEVWVATPDTNYELVGEYVWSINSVRCGGGCAPDRSDININVPDWNVPADALRLAVVPIAMSAAR